MSIPLRPSAPSVGRLTSVVLGFVVLVCVAMIGAAGYMKYRVDRAEAVLTAPDGALGGDQDSFGRVRRDLGYGGFLGQAQRYVLTHDASVFADMKGEIKSSDDIVAHLPDRTSAETRHELASIMASFDAAAQKIGDNPSLTAADLTPLYAAMPVLDERVTASNAEARFAAQGEVQFWAMLLTLVSWGSLILAAGCAAGIYLAVRDKHSAPMRALAQSIQNMARGDMRTAIWGIERQDMIGELARAVDIARYHFSHLPDLSLLSDQGPVRMRFEGETRSLFEAMMKAISRDSENIRAQSSSLTEVVKNQKESITAISEKVETVLQSILQRGQTGDQQIKQAISDMTGSAENLKNAHAHAADQLNRLIPSLQERAAGMAEITHLTGKQIAQTLQSLTASEIGLKANAEQAKTTLVKLASTADDLGERLFGAINLLQASGKVLADTSEQIKAAHGDSVAPSVTADVDLSPLIDRLSGIGVQLNALQAKIEARGDGVSVAPSGTHEMLSLTDVEQVIAPKLAALEQNIVQNGSEAAAQMRSALAALVEKIGAMSAGMPTVELPRGLQDDIHNLSAQIAKTQAEMGRIFADRVEPKLVALEQHIAQSGAAVATQMRDALVGVGEKIVAAAPSADLRQNWQEDLQKLATQIAASQSDIGRALTDKVEPKLAALASAIAQSGGETTTQLRDALAGLVEKMSVLSTGLPAEVRRHVQGDLQNLSAQLAERVEPKLTALARQSDALLARDVVPQIAEHISGIGTRLSAVEQNLTATQKTVITTMEQATAKTIHMMPPELQKQMHDQWFQMSAQIEATRSSLADTIAAQIDKMEARLAEKTAHAPVKLNPDYATQRQIEQQTHILSELVATLGVLDAHMQQIKTEMRAAGG